MLHDPVPADAIVAAARHCPAIAQARQLTTWVGEGKRVTPTPTLQPVDVPTAARALAIPAPARVRRAADVPALHSSWKIALDAGFLQIDDGYARPGPAFAQWPDADGDTVYAVWLAALATAFTVTVPRGDEAGAATVARILLAVLATDPPLAVVELSRRARETFDDQDSGVAFEFFTAWRRTVDPVAAAVDPLVGFGAVERHGQRVRLTPLGHWALQEMQARAPQPITADLPAAELLARLTGIEAGRVWYVAEPWREKRSPLQAARDLLAAAATATPAQRVVAVNLVGELDKPAEEAWDEAKAIPTLAPHARAVECDVLNEQDSAWLAVEYAAATLATSGPDEALTRLAEEIPGEGLDSQLRTVECGAHPATAELAEALTAFLASGVTPTSAQAYQLKISLNRAKPPVWRRVLLPATASLGTLHEVIQVVMGWDGDHLHAFTVGPRHYGDPFYSPDVDDEEGLRCSAAFTSTSTIAYRYDFGDCWDHTITHEKTLDLAPDTTYPVCVAGKGDSPVEDWIEGPESEPFDQDAINRQLAEEEDEENP
ncbi:MAG: IS1096 element passenger TnpR family protein [Pseudonocardia sp.]